MLFVLWFAGGASRADVAGQIVVRAASAALLVAAALLLDHHASTPARPVGWLLLASAFLAVLQLVPLPPALWTALPGRALVEQAALVSGQPQPWRPWSIVPGATINAFCSLIVPVTTWFLLTRLRAEERAALPGLLLIVIAASTLIGLLQFSGAGFDNPLINDTPGMVSGPFANRNHFALFLSFGFLLVPAWMFMGGRRPHWRTPVGLGLVLLFALTILATGSRAGLATGALALVSGLFLTRRRIAAELARYPRWVSLALVLGAIGTLAIFVLISIVADRAVSFDRVFAVDTGQDMRSRGLPTVLAMIRDYFPFGSGLGGFDPVFRIHEPFALLKPTYFNHAHNDFLEIVLDAGAPGVALLLAALGWWIWASAASWRTTKPGDYLLPRLGSAMLLLVVVASVLDYPARTPLMMAMMVMAGTWLSTVSASALPITERDI